MIFQPFNFSTIQLQPVIRGLDVRAREAREPLPVREVVAHVDEIRLFRSDAPDVRKRVIETQVGRVRTLPEAVQDHYVNAADLLYRLVADLVAVADVCEGAYATLTVHSSTLPENISTAGEAVLYRESFGGDAADGELVRARELYHRTEESVLPALRAYVGEYLMDFFDRLWQGVALQRPADDAESPPVRAGRIRVARHLLPVDRVEPPDIVEPGDMIHVGVGEKNGVDLAKAAHGLAVGDYYATRNAIRERLEGASLDRSPDETAAELGLGEFMRV